MKKRLIISFSLKAICLYSLFPSFVSCTDRKEFEPQEEKVVLEQFYKQQLENTFEELDSIVLTQDIAEKKEHFWKARKAFKTIEPILAFLDFENYNYLNQANLLKIDEEDATDIKIKNPVGFQVIEESLYGDNPDEKALKELIYKTSQRVKFLRKNHSLQFVKPHQVLWMIRDGFLRASFLGVTAFDVPESAQTLQEVSWVYDGVLKIITVYTSEFNQKELVQNWQSQIEGTQKKLATSQFDTFNFYQYYKDDVHSKLKLWQKTVQDWKVTFPFQQAIAYDADNLFANTTFNVGYFMDKPDFKLKQEEVTLGKMLFEDSTLSGNGQLSCASCHKQELFLTDGLAKSPGTNRNSPTLFYAALQKGFFHDKRTGSLQGQIIDVVENPNEFHTNLNTVETKVKEHKTYQEKFQQVFGEEVSNVLIREAIASYIASLSPFSSKFDQSMQSEEVVLTPQEINGFNVFMGKGKCATCHFAPLFNGTVPMAYKESELELLGVPKTKDTIHPVLDDDKGRYNLFKTEQRKYFFKTPTVRNSAQTAPYMHNGVYTNLEEVIDFYNKGGGQGLGFDLEYQTLPFDNLQLTSQEKENLVMFLHTLTDRLK